MLSSNCEKMLCVGVMALLVLQIWVIVMLKHQKTENYGYRGGFQGMGSANRQVNEGATW